MNRLTYKTDEGDYTGMPNSIPIEKALEKLAQYEDCDDRVGIPYPILVDALTKGFYTKTTGLGNNNLGKIIITKLKAPSVKLDYETHTRLRFERGVNNRFANNVYEFKDCGKIWALTKEELENGNIE